MYYVPHICILDRERLLITRITAADTSTRLFNVLNVVKWWKKSAEISKTSENEKKRILHGIEHV